MKLKDTGLTKEQLIEKANKYLIDTAARFDFIEERAKGMYVYDTDNRIWSCENLDNKPIGVVTYNLKLVAMDVSGEQIVLSHPENATGEEIEPDRKAYIEFNDFYGGSVDKKTIGKVIIRASVNPIYNPL